MKQEYIIAVKNTGTKTLEKNFVRAGNAADKLLAKAGGLGNAFNASNTALKNLTTTAHRLGRALLGLKPLGPTPYKLITAELQAATVQAHALTAALRAPVPPRGGLPITKHYL